MCGIASIVHFDFQRAVERATLQAMTDTLHHWGPDDYNDEVYNLIIPQDVQRD